jgi:phosphohistidine phosphatase
MRESHNKRSVGESRSDQKKVVKRLFLLRHAKAAPAEPGMDDFDRPLMLSGIEDTGAMARYLCKSEYAFQLVISSSAARTAQTAELVLKELPAEIEYRDTLYLAPPAKILAAVRAAPMGVSGLMIVGHNPGMEDAAALLAREPVRRKERARREVLEEKFPTCALAILDFDVKRWRDVAQEHGKLVDFVRPKDL